MIKRSTRPAAKVARPAVKSNSSAIESDDIPVYTQQEAGDPGEVELEPVVDADYIDGGDVLGEVDEPPAGEEPWNGLDVDSKKYSDEDDVLEVDIPAGEAPVVVVHVANGVYKVKGRVRSLMQGKPLAIKGCKTHVLVPISSGHYAKAQVLGKPTKSMSLFCRVGRIHYNGKGQAIFNQKSNWVLADLKASFVRTSPRKVDVKKVVSSILAGTGSSHASVRPSVRPSARPTVHSRLTSRRSAVRPSSVHRPRLADPLANSSSRGRSASSGRVRSRYERPAYRSRSRVAQGHRSLPFRTSRMTLTSGRVRSSKVALEQSLDVLRRSLPRASVRSRFERSSTRPSVRPSVRAPLQSRASTRLASRSRFEGLSARPSVRSAVRAPKTETRVSSAQTFEAFVASKQKKPAEQVTSRRKTQFDRNVSFLTSGM